MAKKGYHYKTNYDNSGYFIFTIINIVNVIAIRSLIVFITQSII